MIIGINATAALRQPRTGVEEYTYQLIKHLTMLPEAKEHRFFLYVPSFEKGGLGRILKISPTPFFLKRGENNPLDFPLPENFEIKVLRWPLSFLWTQIRLAWEMRRRSPKILFIPVHILPFGAPKNSVVAIHGLEYEYWPQYYPWWHRLYLRWSTKRAVRRAKKIIAISANTKQDLIKLYGAETEKIDVVYHGISSNKNYVISARFAKAPARRAKAGIQDSGCRIKSGMTITKPYILYIGRVETKKNIQGLLEAYKVLKEEYNIPHQLVLAGAPGHGHKALRRALRACSGENVLELGYISEDEKWQLLGGADVFAFPSFYEGFGLPVLEAQISGVPVVCSDGSSLREIAGQGALFVNPQNNTQIAEAIKQVIDDNVLRDRLRQSGEENVKRFSWEKCAKETLEALIKQ